MLEIADDFDQVGVAEPEDAERIARIAAKVRQVYERSSAVRVRLRPPRFVWPLAAAAIVIAGAAIAGGWRPLRPQRLDVTSVKTRAPEPPPVPISPPALRLATPPAAAEQATSPPQPVTKVPKRPAVAPSTTAAELYRGANEARRGGQTTQAIERYQRLQRQFPGSSEALLSRVSLGRLLLQSSSAGAALAQFDAYLAGGSRQRLAPEALFGRGRALQALGRRAEEVQNWRSLIRQHPDSAYADHAGRRLKELR
jgi:TolA-binding protein